MDKKSMIEELEEFSKKTKEDFTIRLIEDLKKKLEQQEKISSYELWDFNRIKEAVKREEKRRIIQRTKKISHENLIYVFKVSLRGRGSKTIEIKNNRLLSSLASDIVDLFNHEPMHLYEFEFNGFKFGPECDEWKEIFDLLDNLRIDSVLNSIEFKPGSEAKFIYDFGENIKHKIKLVNIKKPNENN